MRLLLHVKLLRLDAAWCLVVAALAVPHGVAGQVDPGTEPGAPDEPEAATPAAPEAVPLNAAQAERLDERIAERLRGIFDQVDELQQVRVRVRQGVVRLSGETLDERSAERAVELAHSLQGVVFVDDDIVQAQKVSERVEPMLARIQTKGRTILNQLPVAALALALMLPFWLLAVLVRRWDAPLRWLTDSPLLRDIIQRVLATFVIVLGVVTALELMEATAVVGAVLGTAGLLGVAVGFAFRDLIENYLASIMLGIRRPFAARDHVVIDSHEGLVMRLTTRETILMTLDGNHLRLPNATVFKAGILNYTRNPRRRFEFLVGAGADEDLVMVQQLGVQALRAMSGVIAEPPPFALIEALGDSTVAVRFFGWIDQREVDYLKVRSEAIRRVKTVLDEAGVDMPVPIYRVELQQSSAAQRPRVPPLEPSASPRLPDQAAPEVAPDHHIEAQILEEEATSTEKNLL